MSEKTTDIQRRALLKGEVAKLQAAGMDYDTAYQTAFEGHPELRATGENGQPVGRAAQRGKAQMLNDGSAGDADRTAEIQRLVAAYQQSHPNTPYDVAFTAVLNAPANKVLADSLHRPGRTPQNLFGKFGSGHTPPLPHGPQGQGNPGSSTTPAQRAAKLAM